MTAKCIHSPTGRHIPTMSGGSCAYCYGYEPDSRPGEPMNEGTIRGLTMHVEHGGGAAGSISDPAAFEDGGLEWCLRYAPQVNNCNLQAASVVATFDYLLSGNINMKEATRRLRQMRAARRDRIKPY